MTPGDIIFVYGNPDKCTGKAEQAKLVKFIKDHGKLQEWTVEYLDQEGQFFNVMIKT